MYIIIMNWQQYKYLRVNLPNRLKRYLCKELKRARSIAELDSSDEVLYQILRCNWRHPNRNRFRSRRDWEYIWKEWIYPKHLKHIFLSWNLNVTLRLWGFCWVIKERNGIKKEDLSKLILKEVLPF